MLQFDDVVNAPVGKLKAAAGDWAEMLSRLDQLAEDARTGMKAQADKAEWEGVNAGVTKSFITRTAKEFEDAAAQARGIKSLLEDAHTSFKFAKDELTRIRDYDAPAAGVVVSAAGKVSPKHDLEATGPRTATTRSTRSSYAGRRPLSSPGRGRSTASSRTAPTRTSP
ncbi:hypothetical protein [Streptomyces sp. TE33382]